MTHYNHLYQINYQTQQTLIPFTSDSYHQTSAQSLNTQSKIWMPTQMLTCGTVGIILCILYLIGSVQMCRAKYFLLEATDTFLFYFILIICLIQTVDSFIQMYILWNIQHSLGLELQVIFCLIFTLILDAKKRISLYIRLFFISLIFIVFLLIGKLLLEYYMIDRVISNDWKCAGISSLIIPGASFIASFVLTIIALCGINKVQSKSSVSSNTNSDSSNVNSSGVMSQLNDKGLNLSDFGPQHPVSKPSKKKQSSQKFNKNKDNQLMSSKSSSSFWRTQTIAQVIQQYYTSSQLQIKRKSKQILTLLLINVISISVKFFINFYLTALASQTFSSQVTEQQCTKNLNLGLIPIITINLARAITNYAPYATVYYFIYWKNRKAVRSDSQSSLDFLFNGSSESSRNNLLNDERTPLLPNSDDQNGVDLVGLLQQQRQQRASSINSKAKIGSTPGKKKLIKIKNSRQTIQNIRGQESSGQDNSYDSIIQSNGRSGGSSSSIQSSQNQQYQQSSLDNHKTRYIQRNQEQDEVSLLREKSTFELWNN